MPRSLLVFGQATGNTDMGDLRSSISLSASPNETSGFIDCGEFVITPSAETSRRFSLSLKARRRSPSVTMPASRSLSTIQAAPSGNLVISITNSFIFVCLPTQAILDGGCITSETLKLSFCLVDRLDVFGHNPFPEKFLPLMRTPKHHPKKQTRQNLPSEQFRVDRPLRERKSQGRHRLSSSVLPYRFRKYLRFCSSTFKKRHECQEFRG